jgi:hypothetical protein
VKKELGDELSETQKLSVKSIQSKYTHNSELSMTLDISRTKSNDELKQLATSHQEMNNEMV